MNEDLAYWLQQGLNALRWGSMYALIALGYTMVYGILTMINFAHGDVFMVGAFVCFLAAVYLKANFIVILLVTMLATALLGMAIERLAYRPLRNAPRVSAIITAIGVGLFLENFTLGLCPFPRTVPPMFDDVIWDLGGVILSLKEVVVIGGSMLLMVLLDILIHHTRTGMAMRAISWDRDTAPLMGIPVNRIVAITFAIGAGLAGAAGCMYGLFYGAIDPYIGVMLGWKAFIAAVIGGIGNVRGAVLGAMILAGLETAVVATSDFSSYRDFVAFLLLFVLLIFRPYGLLGTPRIQKV